MSNPAHYSLVAEPEAYDGTKEEGSPTEPLWIRRSTRTLFHTVAELLRGIRDRFLSEAGLEDGAVVKPRIGQFVGGIGALINECEAMRQDLDDPQRNDLDVFGGFQRALERDTCSG